MAGLAFRTSSLRALLTLLALIVLACWVHRTALLDMLLIGAGREEQSHILVAPFIAMWLIWLRRSRFRSLRIQPSLWGPLVIAASWMLSWWSIETDTQVTWHASALLAILGCVISVAGFGTLKQFAPAFLCLCFTIPIPGFIAQAISVPLQNLATGMTELMLDLIGVPATRMGHVLVINGEQVAVGEACNGMRMVFALWLIVYAFAFSTPLRPGVRLVLLGMSPLIALLCNVIRLIPTTLVFGYGTIEQAQQFHDIAGWIMLPIALLMLLGVLRTIRWIELPVMTFRLAMQ
jgi:exosortase